MLMLIKSLSCTSLSINMDKNITRIKSFNEKVSHTLSFFPSCSLILSNSNLSNLSNFTKIIQLRVFFKHCRFWRRNFCRHLFHFFLCIFMLVLPAFIAYTFSDGSCCLVHFKALDWVLENSHTAMLHNTSSSVTDGRIINTRDARGESLALGNDPSPV